MVAGASASTTRPPTSSARLRAYVALTKPRIIELLLVTTVPAMMLAYRGWPGLGLVAATLIGGSLCAGGANALNQALEGDIDSRMRRTSARPLPQGDLPPGHALGFGVVLGVTGFLILWMAANLLAATLAAGALGFYVLVYTIWLKRLTPQNIVVGGAAGAVPTLVGWAAVTGSLAGSAWLLFAVVFFWTPPHFWALALHHVKDYRRAGIPMLPVVRGPEATRVQMLAHTVFTVLASVALILVADMGPAYSVTAIVLGGVFMWQVWGVTRDRRRPMVTFRVSIWYLTILFGAVAIDALVS